MNRNWASAFILRSTRTLHHIDEFSDGITRRPMSHIFAGILGAVAMSATFGAVQLASGSSLSGTPAVIAANAQSDAVNRSGKSDRSAPVTHASSSRTILVAPAGDDATSVLVRIPATVKASASAIRPLTPAQTRRASNFACEPVVSALTDVAKLLGPGCCMT